MAEFGQSPGRDRKGKVKLRHRNKDFKHQNGINEPPIKEIKNDKTKLCKCPYCDDFKGMHTSSERCEHAKKCHIREVTEWLKKGPKGKPRLDETSEQKIRAQGVDPICWAAGLIMCIQ
ncbi:MAG: hypothetical protein ACYCSO_05250 [Cuniculiplasma sp.]